jgi:hypothetical protein
MTAAIYEGLVDPPPNATALIPVQCSSGNCTFPSDNGAWYLSLGMCSSCVGISSNISNNGDIYYYPDNEIDISILHWSCFLQGDEYSEGLSIGHESLMNSTTVYEGASVFGLLTVGPNSTLKGGKCFAVDCQIFPCIKTYGGTNVMNPVPPEEVLGEQPLARYTKNCWMLGLNATLRNGSWHNCYPPNQWNETNVADVEVAPPPGAYWNASDIKNYPSDCEFTMDGALPTPLESRLQTAFFGGYQHLRWA